MLKKNVFDCEKIKKCKSVVKFTIYNNHFYGMEQNFAKINNQLWIFDVYEFEKYQWSNESDYFSCQSILFDVHEVYKSISRSRSRHKLIISH